MTSSTSDEEFVRLDGDLPCSPNSTTSSSSTSTLLTTSTVIDKTPEMETMMARLEDKWMSMIAEKLMDNDVKVKNTIEDNLMELDQVLLK